MHLKDSVPSSKRAEQIKPQPLGFVESIGPVVPALSKSIPSEKPSSEHDDSSTVAGIESAEIDYGDLPLQDYWKDRRVLRRAFKGRDRRSAQSRVVNRPPMMGGDRRGVAPVYRFRQSHRINQLFMVSGDFICLVLAFVIPALSLGLFESRAVPQTHYFADALWQFALVAGLFIGLNWFRGNYSKKCTLGDELGELAKAVFIAVGVQSTIAGLAGNRSILLGLLMTWAIILVTIPIARLVIKRVMYNAGIWTRPTVIIGTGENARKTAEALLSDWLLGFNIVEFIGCHDTTASNHNCCAETDTGGAGSKKFISVQGHKIPVRTLSKLDNQLFKALGNPHIVVAIDTLEFWDVVRLLYEADVPYSSLHIAPSLGGIPMIGLGMTHVFRHDVLMLSVQNNLARFIPRILKRGFDLIVAVTALLLSAPLLMLVAGIVRLSGKNVFYGHERIGQNGKTFQCYKFRSMVNNSQEILDELLRTDATARAEWEKDFKLKNDPRVTPFGAFIRKTSIDELPQFWNVLKGDMSIVGPRPIVADELERYKDKQDLYHLVKPGITGLWQISGRNDISYEERVNLDSWYSRNWSLWYDIIIMFKTVRVVVQRSGAY